MKVAVIGAGPKGLFAVERLLARRGVGPLEVVVFDPRAPGEGAAYGREQPDWLRLNVTSAVVDAGWRSGPYPSPNWLVSFDLWRGAGTGSFAPRHLVGTYLDWVWRGLLATLPEGITLTHHRRLVTRVAQAGSTWEVDEERFGEVLLATGHAEDWPGALRHHWRGPERLVPHVFPLAGLDDIVPGEAVAVRGAALTFLDAALALTQGRGGTFTGDGPLRYHPEGIEPGVIWPTSRTGRWMEVKPEPGSLLATLDRSALVAAASASITTEESPHIALGQVERLARGLLDLVGVGDDDDDGVAAVLAGAAEGDPTDCLRRSWEVATGRRAPSAGWAAGQAWRDLYPALAHRFAGIEAPDDFHVFADAAARLERIAFGPPPENAAKLLALIDAHMVDPCALKGASVDAAGLRWRAGPGPRADVVVDAVLPPPGVAQLPDSLPGQLGAAQLLMSAKGRRGVAIDPDGTCLAADGSRRSGLAALGRPTEDVTIGNDTLNRSMHDTAERWAARVTATRTES